MTAKELFLGGAGHHVEELHPRNIELTLQVSQIASTQDFDEVP